MVQATYSQTYKVYSNGVIDVNCIYTAGETKLPILPRQGTQLQLTTTFANIEWYGTGKSPTIEYLVRLLQNDYKLAILSRGYKRESRGFQIANERSDARQIGDEPFQFYQKFNSITVAVDADRQNGISNLISKVRPEVILLDDAFQHRKVKPGFSILLTSYDNLYSKDIVLPTGNLREPRSGAKRANCIIVTKCPSQLTSSQKASIISGLKPETKQRAPETYRETMKQ